MSNPHPLRFISVLAVTAVLGGLAIHSAFAETKRPILIRFGATWCTGCNQMNSKVFEKSEFKEFAAGQFDIIDLDYDQLANPKDTPPALLEINKRIEDPLIRKMITEGNPERGYPFYLVVDAEGKDVKGFVTPTTHLKDFQAKLSEALKTPASQARRQLEERLIAAYSLDEFERVQQKKIMAEAVPKDPNKTLPELVQINANWGPLAPEITLSHDLKSVPRLCTSKHTKKDRALREAYKTGFIKAADGRDWGDSLDVPSWNSMDKNPFSPKDPNRDACRDYPPSSNPNTQKLRDCCTQGFRKALPDLALSIDWGASNRDPAAVQCKKEYRLGVEKAQQNCPENRSEQCPDNSITEKIQYLACFHLGFKSTYKRCLRQSTPDIAICEREEKILDSMMKAGMMSDSDTPPTAGVTESKR